VVRDAREPERVVRFVFTATICPERVEIFPVAVTRFVFVVVRFAITVFIWF
jgi:hypothetical protein